MSVEHLLGPSTGCLADSNWVKADRVLDEIGEMRHQAQVKLLNVVDPYQ